MSYCEKCGAKLEKNAKFCEECGERVEESESINSMKSPKKTVPKEDVSEKDVPKENIQEKAIPKKDVPKEAVEEKNAPEKTTPNKERQPLTKKQRVMGVSVLGIILFLFLGYQVGASVNSQENQTDHIIEALSSKDSERLADVITTNDSNFKVNSENLESFVSYLEENPNYLSEMISELNNYGGYDSFYIEQNGKKFGLYDSYELVMTPIYGTIYTNAEGVAVSLLEEELFLSDNEDFSQEVGPFAPGILTFTAEGEVNEFPISVTREVTWLNADAYNELDLELTGDYFSINSDLENATVYINDKNIGQLEDGYGEFGPIQIESGMELYIAQKIGDEEITSEVVELTEDDSNYEFYDLVIGNANDASQLLESSYYTASQLTTNYEAYIKDYNGYYHPEGPAYEDQRLAFLSFGESISNNDDINSVDYDVSINEVERISSKAFDIDYEVTYTTYYPYNSDREDGLRHYSKEATVMFEPTNHPNRDYDIFIYEMKNEELLYEEGDDGSTESTSATSEDDEEKASAVVTNFVQNMAKAVNNNNFSAIASYIDSSSDLYESQSSFVTDTHNRGITEELDYLEIVDTSIDGKVAKVKTNEQFTITKEDSVSESEYVAFYDLKKVKGNYLITNLVIE